MYGYIYKIENLVNGKVYIGQTVQIPQKRKSRHFYQLRNNKHRNSHLQNSFNKYGENHFKFSIISWFNNEEELNKAEIYYINIYDAFNSKHGYNLQSGGSNGKHAEETKQKMSIGKKGEKAYWYGKKLSAEHRIKISENNGRPMLGKKHTKKTKEKISNSLKGKTLSKETRKKMSIARKGKTFTNEHRRKMSENNAKTGTGLFRFPGATLKKQDNPERKCWQSQISCKGKPKSLGVYHDPLSASIVFH